LNTLLVAATSAFLFLAPFAGSAGLRSAMIIIAAIALVVARGKRLGTDVRLAPRAVAVAYAAWALLCVGSLAWSVDVRYTLSELRAETLYATLAFAVFHVAAENLSRWRSWWLALMSGTLAVAIAEIVQQLLPTPLSRHPLDGGPGPWSTHLVVVAPLLLVFVWQAPWGRGRREGALVASLIALLIAAWATENRIVWAAFGAQLAVILALRQNAPDLTASGRRKARVLVTLTIAAVVIAFGASIVERNDRLFTSKSRVTTGLERDVRPLIWSAAWDEFRTAPWLGHGFGREILADRFLPFTPKSGDHPPLRHAHNVFFDVALELGLAGLGVFVVLLLAMSREYVRYLRDAVAAPLGIMGLALIAGFIVKSLTDDFLHRHNALMFWALNGMLLGLGRRRKAAP
jgi:O-antigen ligase